MTRGRDALTLELCSAPALDNVHGRSFVKLASRGLDRRWRHSWFYEYNYEKQFPEGVKTDLPDESIR